MTLHRILEKILRLTPYWLRRNIKNIPFVKQCQEMIQKKFLDGTEFLTTITAGPAKGLNLLIKLPQDKQMWVGTWEIKFAETLKKFIQPNWICYDIGGYKGYYGGIMALSKARKVYVFEPLPSNAEQVKQMISNNPLLPIVLEQMAISDKKSRSIFKIMPEETMGKLESSTFQNDEAEVKILEVNCNSIDNLMDSGYPKPHFIKIDVEGAEEFVLKGAEKLLNESKPILMIEIHSSEIGKRCLNILNKYYSNIIVLETGKSPEMGAPEICHYIVKAV